MMSGSGFISGSLSVFSSPSRAEARFPFVGRILSYVEAVAHTEIVMLVSNGSPPSQEALIRSNLPLLSFLMNCGPILVQILIGPCQSILLLSSVF